MALYKVKNVRWSQKIKHFDVEMNPIFFCVGMFYESKQLLSRAYFIFIHIIVM